MQPWIATRPASWSLILPGEFQTDLLLFFDRFLFDRMYVDPTLFVTRTIRSCPLSELYSNLTIPPMTLFFADFQPGFLYR